MYRLGDLQLGGVQQGKGVLEISSDGDYQSIFLGSKFLFLDF